MKTIRLLKIIFDLNLEKWEIPAFRGAIISAISDKNILFHNHLENGFRYAYPLIQYKTIGGRATILCVEEGVDQIHHFFENSEWQLRIGDKTVEAKIYNIDLKQYNLQVWNKTFCYNLVNWVALNQESYLEYHKMLGIVDKTKYLESKLTGNILSFAKGIGWQIEKEIFTKIYTTPVHHFVKIKGVRLMAFKTQFASNVFLPNNIGLGNNVSFGYGLINVIRKNEDEQQP